MPLAFDILDVLGGLIDMLVYVGLGVRVEVIFWVKCGSGLKRMVECLMLL